MKTLMKKTLSILTVLAMLLCVLPAFADEAPEAQIPTFEVGRGMAGYIVPDAATEMKAHAGQKGDVRFTLTLSDNSVQDVTVLVDGAGVSLNRPDAGRAVFTFVKGFAWNESRIISLRADRTMEFTLISELLPEEPAPAPAPAPVAKSEPEQEPVEEEPAPEVETEQEPVEEEPAPAAEPEQEPVVEEPAPEEEPEQEPVEEEPTTEEEPEQEPVVEEPAPEEEPEQEPVEEAPAPAAEPEQEPADEEPAPETEPEQEPVEEEPAPEEEPEEEPVEEEPAADVEDKPTEEIETPAEEKETEVGTETPEQPADDDAPAAAETVEEVKEDIKLEVEAPAETEEAEETVEEEKEPAKTETQIATAEEEPAEEVEEEEEETSDFEGIEVVVTKILKLNEIWEGTIHRKNPAVLLLDVPNAQTINLLIEGKDIVATILKSDQQTEDATQYTTDDATNRVLIEWKAEAGRYMITLGAGDNSLIAKPRVIAMDEETTLKWAENASIDLIKEDGEQEEVSEEEPEETKEAAEEEVERSIYITLTWDVDVPAIGDIGHLRSILTGYDNVNYSLQWQISKDQENWSDFEGGTTPELDVELTEELNNTYFRLMLYVEQCKQES